MSVNLQTFYAKLRNKKPHLSESHVKKNVNQLYRAQMNAIVHTWIFLLISGYKFLITGFMFLDNFNLVPHLMDIHNVTITYHRKAGKKTDERLTF